MNNFIHSLRLIMINILITITLISIFYNLRKFINKNYITKLIFGIIFGLGLMTIIYISNDNESHLIFYDARFSYITFLLIYFNYLSVLLGVFIVIIHFIIKYQGLALFLHLLSVLIPVATIFTLKRFKNPAQLKYKTNLLLSFLMNLALFALVYIFHEVDIGDVLALLFFNPFIYAQTIKIIQMLTTYFEEIDEEILKNKLYSKALDSTNEFEIYILDRDYQYVYSNKYHRYEMQKFNKSKIALKTNFLSVVKDDNVRARLKKNINLAFIGKEINETILIEDGNNNYLEEHYTPILNKNGIIERVSVFSHNITEQVNYKKQIYLLSNYDSLTNLLNRRSLNRDITSYEAIENLTIVFFDINNLKFINDVFGHNYGDQLLKEVANEIIKTYGSYASIYRIGGDEFIVVYRKKQCNDLDNANLVKQRLSKKTINKIPIKVSLGVAKRSKNQSFDELLSEAEAQMYKRKINSSKKELENNIQIIYKELKNDKIIDEKELDELIHLAIIFKDCLDMDKDKFNQLIKLIKYHKIGLINGFSKSSDECIESSYRILQTSKEFSQVADDIIHLYENYDGSGKPQNLKADEINLNARILRIIKDYHYYSKNKFYDQNKIKEILSNFSGKIYDPRLLKIFIDNL